jgi:PAS domain-containing protein
MQTGPLRKLVQVIALAIAIITAIAVPAGFFAFGYTNSAHTLAFKSRLNAARVAQYIYTHEVMWQYQQLRLSELIQLPESNEQPIRQKVYDLNDQLVLDEGAPLAAPIMSRRAPIVVGDVVNGSLVVETSLSGLVNETAFVALMSSLLGFAIYFALRLLPLRVLDRVLGDLKTAERNLADQNKRLDAALNNMSQGLVMFDSAARLVVYNKRYLDMFGLSPERIKPGCAIRDLLAQRVASGSFSAEDVDAYRADLLVAVAQGKTFSKITHLQDGRTISVANQPTGDGGWVATHEDITERLLAEEKIKHLARYDALTDLPNRVHFYERMGSILGHL